MQEHTKLSLDERTILFIKIQLGLPVKVIAKELKRDPSTIYREIGRNKSPGRHGIADYFPSTAHALAQKRKSSNSRGNRNKKAFPCLKNRIGIF